MGLNGDGSKALPPHFPVPLSLEMATEVLSYDGHSPALDSELQAEPPCSG